MVGQEGTTQRSESGPAVGGFEVRDSTLRAYDKATGRVVGEISLPRNATGALMTYIGYRPDGAADNSVIQPVRVRSC
jgi:hypothetical protein